MAERKTSHQSVEQFQVKAFSDDYHEMGENKKKIVIFNKRVKLIITRPLGCGKEREPFLDKLSERFCFNIWGKKAYQMEMEADSR